MHDTMILNLKKSSSATCFKVPKKQILVPKSKKNKQRNSTVSTTSIALLSMKKRSLFLIRDADALGITFQDVPINGNKKKKKVQIMKMSLPGLGGIYPGDFLLDNLDTTLNDLLNSNSKPLLLQFRENSEITQNRDLYPQPDESIFERVQILCSKNKYSEAAATLSLVEEDNPLIVCNRSSALQLSNDIDTAIIEANRLIQRWPQWEMGYVRKCSCFLQQVEHGILENISPIIQCLSLGLTRIPENITLLWRMRRLIPENLSEVTCLGTEEDTAISIFKIFHLEDFFNKFTFSNDLRGGEFGLKTKMNLNQTVLANSIALNVNGLNTSEVYNFQELKQRFTSSECQVVVVIWKLGNSSNPVRKSNLLASKSFTRSFYNSNGNNPMQDEEDDVQILLRLQAVPTCKDTVIVFGSGCNECNGVYYPQGMRHEKYWFENEHGCCLSYEISNSGIGSWVLGRPLDSKILYVLRPGHEPRGEDFGQWITICEPYQPAPSFVGVGDKIVSLKKLTTWFRETKENSSHVETPSAYLQTLVPQLLALKGYAMRLIEGGWPDEAIGILELIRDQAFALAVGDDRCSTNQLSRIVQGTTGLLELARKKAGKEFQEEEKNDTSPRNIQMYDDILQKGFELILLETGAKRKVRISDDLLNITQEDAIEQDDMESKFNSNTNSKRKAKRSWFFSLGCTRVPPPPATPLTVPVFKSKTAQYHREDVSFSYSDSQLKINFERKGEEALFVLEDEKIFKALQLWKSVE